MKALRLRRLLESVLLVGGPLALTHCSTIESSCPDDGFEPPITASVPVEAGLADGGALDAAQCQAVCDDSGSPLVTCVRESPTSVLCVNQPFPCEGRRPAGLRPVKRVADTAFACHLADAAWLEAASVDAFRLLRRELRSYGAPKRLLRSASRSRRDERRHARATRALARRFGVGVPPLQCDPASTRSLEALALDNAVEGCVRETWGALIALRQASRAIEPAVRAALGRIARDEVRHAELAWAIERWLRPRLSAEQRARVRAARTLAMAELAGEVRLELPRAERDRLGLPAGDEALAMLAELDRSLALTGPA